MGELSDYSGSFNPDLTFHDFSKDFLLKLVGTWQWAWLQLDSAFFDPILQKSDLDTVMKHATDVWVRIAEDCNPKFAAMANIGMTNTVDCLKVYQLPLDNTMGSVYQNSYEIHDENFVTVKIERCPSLEWLEQRAPERIKGVCHDLEGKVIDKYKVNMDVKFQQLTLPPREKPEGLCCSYQLKLDSAKGVKVRSKDEVVDETKDVPLVDDLSGPFYPNLTHQQFSKDFLIKTKEYFTKKNQQKVKIIGKS